MVPPTVMLPPLHSLCGRFSLIPVEEFLVPWEMASRMRLALFTRLLEACGVPRGLRDLGLDREVLTEATDRIMVDQYFCARPYERDEILARLEEAWRGRSPS